MNGAARNSGCGGPSPDHAHVGFRMSSTGSIWSWSQPNSSKPQMKLSAGSCASISRLPPRSSPGPGFPGFKKLWIDMNGLDNVDDQTIVSFSNTSGDG